LLAALTETIPIIGPIIGAVPAILLAYLVSPALALKVLIFFLVIHQLENHIIVPKIMGHNIALHPVVIIISLLIGGQLMGIIGMMLAVPIAAILKVVLKHLWYQEES
jgi:predicted PurR-regulated permease PerM